MKNCIDDRTVSLAIFIYRCLKLKIEETKILLLYLLSMCFLILFTRIESYDSCFLFHSNHTTIISFSVSCRCRKRRSTATSISTLGFHQIFLFNNVTVERGSTGRDCFFSKACRSFNFFSISYVRLMNISVI